MVKAKETNHWGTKEETKAAFRARVIVNKNPAS